MSKKKVIKNARIVLGAFGAEKDCTGVVEKVDYPDTGGIFTKYIGCNYLYKGYPNLDIINHIYASKRIIIGLFTLDKSVKFLLGITFLFYLILPGFIKRKVIIGLLDYILGITHWIEYSRPFALPTNHYCQAVREIYRVSDTFYIKDKEILTRVNKLRDIVCMILEMDYAYRARFQDILPEFDKNKLKQNPKKEIQRVLDIFIQREGLERIGNTNCFYTPNGSEGMLSKWRGLKRIFNIVWRFKGLRELIVKGLLEIDLDKIKFDEADFYYVCDRKDYAYCGLSYQERMKLATELDKKMGNKRPKVIYKDLKWFQIDK